VISEGSVFCWCSLVAGFQCRAPSLPSRH